MTRMNSVKHVLLALGLGTMAAACDGGGGMTQTKMYADIQADMKSLTCLQSGCHNATATNKLKIDTTAGKEMDNYNSLFTNQLVTKNDAANSPLIKIPSTGTLAAGGTHVKLLTGSKLMDWQTWVNAGAPF